MFVRSATIIFPLFCFLYFRSGFSSFRTERKQDHLVRTVYNFTAFLAYYFAVTRLTLAEATAISLSAPLFVTLLSGPLLGEPASWERKSILVIGFIGVLIVIQPEFGNTDWLGVAAAVLGAFLFAMLAIQTRKMSATEDTEQMVFFSASAFFVVTSISLFFVWETPQPLDLVIMIGLGVVAFCAQFCVIHAYQFATVYTLAPLDYIVILWALILGWFVFNDFPSTIMLIGCVVIVVSGLWLVYVERQEKLARQ